MGTTRYDDVIIGAGHNGLTAAAYLARVGRRVLVLERADHVGGATVSAMPFPGLPARLSRYSYLVSLLPGQIITDLELDITLASRRISSYTPMPMDPTRGLLIDSADRNARARSFERITGSDNDFHAWEQFYSAMSAIAERLFPTLLEPLRSAADIAGIVGADSSTAQLWQQLTSEPLGALIERRFADDLVRGVVATDGLIGTFADLHDASLQQNICFLYHLIGGGTGQWQVPVGGMGAVSGALYEAALAAGAVIRTGVDVDGVDPGSEHSSAIVEFTERTAVGTPSTTASAESVFVACAPESINPVLPQPLAVPSDVHGSQLKINLLLDRLPGLRDRTVDPADAFAGTLHVHEGYEALSTAWRQAHRGEVPQTPPCEVYCHTLADHTILGSELAGMHTLTVFGLHTPPDCLDSPGATEHAVGATLAALNSVLAEPIQSVIATDLHGNPCIEVKTPQDLEDDLGMPGGNIFHRPLQWPWAENTAEVGTWGTETAHPRLMLAGAAARRGGGVSGIAGRNAAAAVLGE